MTRQPEQRRPDAPSDRPAATATAAGAPPADGRAGTGRSGQQRLTSRSRRPTVTTEEFRPMPKMKTDRGAAKRFKITGTGKLRRRQAFRSHMLEKKSSTRTRRLGREADVAPGDVKAVKRLLGL